MNRPQIIHPITGKITNLYSKEVEALFDEGYKLSYSLSLQILKLSPYIPLTRIEDVDLHTMSYLEPKHIGLLAQINKYTYQLSQNQQLWRDKTLLDFVHQPPVIEYIEGINWKKLYQAYHLYKNNINYLLEKEPTICYKIIKDITPWLNKFNINVNFNCQLIEFSYGNISFFNSNFIKYKYIRDTNIYSLMILLYYDDAVTKGWY